MSLDLRSKAGAAGEASERADFRARLRTRREALAKGSTRLFVLPGYDSDNEALGGQLVARYRRLTYDELRNVFVEKAGDKDIVGLNVQFLVDACDEILFRDADGYHPLVPGFKTTYTVNLESGESLATIMGVEHLATVREQVIAAFGDNDLAVNDHSGEVHRWMVAANTEDGEQALGEA